MGMIDAMYRAKIDSNITFVYFIRIDTQMRLDNIEYVSKFYQKHMPKAKHVFVEETGFKEDHLLARDVIDVREQDTYIEIPVGIGNQWNKCIGYNTGLLKVETDVVVFNDVDAVIDPTQIRRTGEHIINGDADIMYPYNGEWLCVNNVELKKRFGKTLDYTVLSRAYPEWIKSPLDPNTAARFVNTTTPAGILFGHWNSRGGCVMGNTQKVIEGKGYNPNFVGWGYEDDEFPVRMHKLGFVVSRLFGPKLPCWHLTHTCEGQSEKETQPHHEENRLLCGQVEEMTHDEAWKYIQTWDL